MTEINENRENTAPSVTGRVILSKDPPPSSQAEREHRAYLRLRQKYEEYKEKRIRYRTVGITFVILSALVYLALMFSLPSKVFFLIMWIITILACVALMLRTDYLYNMYREMLELPDDEEETSPPSTPDSHSH